MRKYSVCFLFVTMLLPAASRPRAVPAYDPTQGLQFIPLSPCRLVDTRNPAGPFGGPEMTAGSSRSFDIPAGVCNVPSSALAYSLNFTVVPDGNLGYLSTWPKGQTQPLVSTLNSDGRVKANAAIVPAGANGGISVYVSDPTQVIVDVNGYFVAAGTVSALSFYPLTPCRIADTRNAAGTFGGPFLAGAQSRTFPIQSSTCNVPADAQAYSLNLTVVPHVPLGYLSTWPAGEAQPLVSTLNTSTTDVTANAAIVPAGASGDISIYASNDTDLVLDINGYFAAPATQGLSLFPVTPCRILDTRTPAGGAAPISGVLPVSPGIGGCSLPLSAQAFVMNATVVPDSELGYIALWPDGQTQPLVSTLNAGDSAVTSNMAIVPSIDGSIDAYASSATHLILDVSSYFSVGGGGNQPLSSISLASTGIDLTSPFSVQFSDGNGFTVQESASSVTTNGIVISTVPIYLNPATMQTMAGTLSAMVVQGTVTTPPVAVSIQDLPSVSSYGLQPGQATHAMYVFDAMLLGRRINQLEALQNLPGNTVDTTAAQATLNQLLLDTMEARYDVDQVAQNPSTVIQDVTLPNGLTVTFNSDTLDMMDRINALYVSQTFGSLPVPSGSTRGGGQPSRRSSSSSNLSAVFSSMQSANGVKDWTESFSTLQEAKSWTDYVKGMAQAAGGTVDYLVGTGQAPDTTGTKLFGLVGAVLQDARVTGDAFAQDAAFVVGWATGNQALQDVAVQAMAQSQADASKAALDLIIALAGGPAGEELLGSTSTVAGYIKNLAEIYNAAGETQADQTQLDVTNGALMLPAAAAQDLGYVAGGADISNSLGYAGSQTGISVSSDGIEFNTLADPNGNYEVIVPLQTSGFDYTNATVEAYDPVTGNLINSEAVDLSGLAATTQVTPPILTGSCIDDDDDGDDPDCDSTANTRNGSGRQHAPVRIHQKELRQAAPIQ